MWNGKAKIYGYGNKIEYEGEIVNGNKICNNQYIIKMILF